jgi:uncharacterized membrane protein YqaE (UPF0057 family)
MNNRKITPYHFAAIFFALTIFVSSCSTISISQRRYNKGFHIEFGGNGVKNSNKDKIAKSESLQSEDKFCTENITESDNKQSNEAGVIYTETLVSETIVPMGEYSYTITSTEVTVPKKEGETIEKISTKEISTQKKELKKAIKTFHKNKNEVQVSDRMLLLTIIAILLPPLAVYLYEGSWTINCTLNLILTILGWLPGVIHALLIIYGYI